MVPTSFRAGIVALLISTQRAYGLDEGSKVIETKNKHVKEYTIEDVRKLARNSRMSEVVARLDEVQRYRQPLNADLLNTT